MPNQATTVFLSVGQSVRTENASDGSITKSPVVERLSLEALLAGVTKENMPDGADVSWGKPVGSEACCWLQHGAD
jgi:antitoxin component of MazEF toxin-antitoxin module